jgi:hypothetical protein
MSPWDLGVHEEALRQWARPAEAEQGDRPDLLSTAEKQNSPGSTRSTPSCGGRTTS